MQPLVLIIATLVILGSGLFASKHTPETAANVPGAQETPIEQPHTEQPPVPEVPNATTTATSTSATTTDAAPPAPSGDDDEDPDISLGSSSNQNRLIEWEEAVASYINEELLRLQPGSQGNVKGSFSVQEILAYTNGHRTDEGLNVLTLDSQLTDIAEAKVADMFAKNYFAHVSPSGVDISALARQYGYAYLLIGENLAQGNFKNTEQLVDAWMDSQGHRANILHTRYTHTGIAIDEGEINGKKNWLAVQVFGTPQSVCTYPSASLKSTVQSNKAQLDSLQATITSERTAIQNLSPESNSYNERVSNFNTRVSAYNTLLAQQKIIVGQYNAQVEGYNACIAARTR